MKNVQRATIKDVAEYAYSSVSTVSKALNGKGYVSEATKKRINDAVIKLDYHIDKNARNLRSKKSHHIGIVLHNHIDIDGHKSPFISDMMLAIAHQIEQRGYESVFLETNIHNDWYKEKEWYSSIESGEVDGFILLGGNNNNQLYSKRIHELNAKKVAFVAWGDTASIAENKYCNVSTDGKSGAHQAVKHLLKLGRKNIAFIGLDKGQQNFEMEQRRQGYLDAMLEAGYTDTKKLNALQALIPYSKTENITSFNTAQRITQQLIDSSKHFDAIFAVTDLMAMGAINTLHNNGLDTPRDVAVIGFDDISMAKYFNPPLTTVSQNIGESGALLADKLIGLLNGRKETSMSLPCNLVIRESCGAKLVTEYN